GIPVAAIAQQRAKARRRLACPQHVLLSRAGDAKWCHTTTVKDHSGRLKWNRWEGTMPKTPWDRRELLKTISVGAATGLLVGSGAPAAAQQVKWSEGAEPPKLKAPPNACDCHHHIYDSQYPVDPKAVLRPGDALVDDYRAFQKRIGTSRNVV